MGTIEHPLTRVRTLFTNFFLMQECELRTARSTAKLVRSRQL